MIKTEITTGVDVDTWVQTVNRSHNIDLLAEDIKEEALSFLDSHAIPYAEIPAGDLGCISKEWIAKYDHIPGARAAFGMLFELHSFREARKLNLSEMAYSHLLRIVARQKIITIARMEAQYFAGKGTQYGGNKASLRSIARHRKDQLLNVFCKYRDKGKDRATSRRLAGEEVGLKQRQVDNYWSAANIEAEYQKIKISKT